VIKRKRRKNPARISSATLGSDNGQKKEKKKGKIPMDLVLLGG
jgi:hypothetical protein